MSDPVAELIAEAKRAVISIETLTLYVPTVESQEVYLKDAESLRQSIRKAEEAQ